MSISLLNLKYASTSRERLRLLMDGTLIALTNTSSSHKQDSNLLFSLVIPLLFFYGSSVRLLLLIIRIQNCCSLSLFILSLSSSSTTTLTSRLHANNTNHLPFNPHQLILLLSNLLHSTPNTLSNNTPHPLRQPKLLIQINHPIHTILH